MGIGGSIFLLALGAILVWAVHIQLGWLDLRVVGWVLMVAGFVGLILTIWFWNNRRRRITTTTGAVPVERERVVEYDDRPVGPPDQRY
ncbi:MAG TPA: DUF6458 family protein [Rugosimonospora sp.]|nr:DUF6458 family protein [Rugosimonospora sp.]